MCGRLKLFLWVALLTSSQALAKPLVVAETGCVGCTQEHLDEPKAVDPKHKLSDSQRNMLGYSRMWEFYMQRGDAKKAEQAVKSLLQTYRAASNRFAAISAAALEGGDLDGATRAAMRAYVYIPDGRDLQLRVGKDGRIGYSYTDEKTGEEIAKGFLTPDEMLQHVTAGGMRNLGDLELAAGARK